MSSDTHSFHQLSDSNLSSSVGFDPPSSDSRQGPGMTPESSSNDSSTSSSSRSPTPSTATRVEDTDSIGSGKEGLQEARPGEGVPSSPTSSSVDGEVRTTVHADDVLNHLLNGAKYVVDVEDLVQSARESFQQIVEFCEAKSAHGHPAVIALEKEVRVVYDDYLKAIETSVKVAGHGITFAADAVSLCEYLSQDPGTDVHSFIDEMKKIAGLAHGDAVDTYKKFSAVRATLFLIIKRIARQEMQIKDGNDDHKRDRNMDQDPLGALELLNKAANSVDRVVECVDKFANWWGNAETMISTLGNQVVSADGRRLSTIRINMVQKSWEVLQKEYEVYKRSINTLSDFYPVGNMRPSAPWFKRIFRKKAAKV